LEWWEIVGVAILITPLALTLVFLTYFFIYEGVRDFLRSRRRRPSRKPGEPGFDVPLETPPEDELKSYIEDLKKRRKKNKER